MWTSECQSMSAGNIWQQIFANSCIVVSMSAVSAQMSQQNIAHRAPIWMSTSTPNLEPTLADLMAKSHQLACWYGLNVAVSKALYSTAVRSQLVLYSVLSLRCSAWACKRIWRASKPALNRIGAQCASQCMLFFSLHFLLLLQECRLHSVYTQKEYLALENAISPYGTHIFHYLSCKLDFWCVSSALR